MLSYSSRWLRRWSHCSWRVLNSSRIWLKHWLRVEKALGPCGPAPVGCRCLCCGGRGVSVGGRKGRRRGERCARCILWRTLGVMGEIWREALGGRRLKTRLALADCPHVARPSLPNLRSPPTPTQRARRLPHSRPTPYIPRVAMTPAQIQILSSLPLTSPLPPRTPNSRPLLRIAHADLPAETTLVGPSAARGPRRPSAVACLHRPSLLARRCYS